MATACFTAPNAGKLDLLHLARHCRNVQYHPARFPGILIKVSVPHVTARVFASGKVVLLGAKSKDEALAGMKVICRMIIKVSGDKFLSVNDFQVRNIVANGSIGGPLKL